MSDGGSGKISIEDAIKLKHSLDKSITYGGYNAKEIKEMRDLTKEQYSEVNRQLSEIRKNWWCLPDYVWIIGIIASVVCLFYFQWVFIHMACVVVLAYCVAQLGYRSGVLYGYVRGYESGHVEGVHKSLGISHGIADIGQRAIDMELDEMLIKGFDERKNQQQEHL